MASTAVWAVFAPLTGLAACVLVHVALAHVPAVSRPRSAITGVALGMIVVVGISFLLKMAMRDFVEYAIAWSAIYICLAYCYVIGFYNSGESARRIRLLTELRAAGARGLTQQQVLAAYNGRMIIDLRLQRLLAGRQVIEREGRYVVGRHEMLSIAALLDWWGRVTQTTPGSRAA